MTGTLSPARRRVGPLTLTVQVKRRPTVTSGPPQGGMLFCG